MSNQRPHWSLEFVFLAGLCLMPFAVGGFISFSGGEGGPPRLELAQRIGRTLAVIERNYYDPQRVHPDKMLKEGLNVLANRIPEMLVRFPEGSSSQWGLSVADKTKTLSYQTPKTLADILTPAAQAMTFLAESYQGDVKPEDREYAFIAGLLNTLDPHSNLLTPEVFKEFKTQTEGEYGGIGIVVGIKEEELSVIAPLEGTPAARAGVLAEDKIVEIDGNPTVNMPLSQAVEKLRGKIGTRVVLNLSRKGRSPWEVTLIRENIVIESVKSKVAMAGQKRIGVLSVRSFQEDTYADMEKALKGMTADGQKLNGLVMDLRNNPGGLLDQSLEMADKFLSQGDILYTVGGAGMEEEVSRARSAPTDVTDVPLIILVNQGSASASEIVAGALKNNNRALVMGTGTFGKGSVQSLFGLKDGSSLKLTIAQYLTPGRVSIQAVGITPDIRLIPSLVNEETRDLWDEEMVGEATLEEHLENASYVKETKPSYFLRYLDAAKTPADSEYTAKIDTEKDYPVALALTLLSKTLSVDRTALLKEALPVLNEQGQKQDQLITQELKKYGIDWKPPAPSDPKGEAVVTLSSRFLDKKSGQPVTQLKGGQEVEWVLQAVNSGPVDVARLLGVIRSENSLFDQREFLFGRVASGQSGEARVSVKIPEEAPPFSEKMRIDFYASRDVKIPSLAVPLDVAEKEKPVLAYKFSLKDDGTDGSRGNGNKIPEKGEVIALEVALKNASPYSAKQVVLNLKNGEDQEGVYLRQGRADVGELGPFMEKSGKVLFEIAGDFGGAGVELILTAMDKPTRGGIEDTLKFSLNAAATGLVPVEPVEWRTAPVIAVSQKEWLSEGGRFSIAGVATDDGSLGDLIIYAAGKKIFYKAGGAALKELPFQASFSLEEGANLVIIQARDQNRFASQKVFSVMGKERKELARRGDPHLDSVNPL